MKYFTVLLLFGLVISSCWKDGDIIEVEIDYQSDWSSDPDDPDDMLWKFPGITEQGDTMWVKIGQRDLAGRLFQYKYLYSIGEQSVPSKILVVALDKKTYGIFPKREDLP